jgi:isopentenyl diphosphate isomerase/L-lactate dehydrogenase-like FMN-dependent dehydrogenase
VLLAPVGHLQRVDPGGGATVAEAATAYGVGMMKSSVAEPDIEVVAQAGGDGLKVYQLYVRGDAAWVDDCFLRAMASGYDAICVTVDTAYISRRERDITKRWTRPQSGSDFQSSVSWSDVERYRALITVPFFLKGIATVADAVRAVALGVDGIYVSNHGGRQLDHGRGSLDVLPEIVAAVAGRATIVVDGGFSRGTDVVKAIALGADVVGIGRLYLYALAVAGAPGVVRLLEILGDEIHSCLALLGICSFEALTAGYVCRAQPIGTPGVHSAFPLMTLPPERPYESG